MDYLYDAGDDRQAMLREIGVGSVAELFDGVPPSCQLARKLDLPVGLGELELQQHMDALSARNHHAENATCFLGGGSYDHFIPSVVDAIASRGEYYTSYTPYQPEASQGNLQVMFEYQSLICELTGMDVSNASLYDGGSAVTEAALMAAQVTRRRRVVVPTSLHPEFRQILQTYLRHLDLEVETLDVGIGTWDIERLKGEVGDETACVVVQQPNFFGQVESLSRLADVVHAAGALLVVSCDPISLGLLKRPGDVGADIVVAEGQSLGSPMSYGGPYLGIMACREAFMRRMPGRIAGETIDRKGRRCWVLTLQTREQHIRREKATSNICTNQGLLALRAAIYLSAVGGQGLREVADLSARKARYARQQLATDARFEIVADHDAMFKEFVVRDRANQVDELLDYAAKHRILAGLPLRRWYPDYGDCFLVAVTEKRTRAEIDAWVHCLQGHDRQVATSEVEVVHHA